MFKEFIHSSHLPSFILLLWKAASWHHYHDEAGNDDGNIRHVELLVITEDIFTDKYYDECVTLQMGSLSHKLSLKR